VSDEAPKKNLGGRPKDQHRAKLAETVGIHFSRAAKVSTHRLEQLAGLAESERNLIIIGVGHKHGRAPRYRKSVVGMKRKTKVFQSYSLAQMVAHSLQTMTGEKCAIEEKDKGKFIVVRYCYGGKVVEV
jgi:hypothetical protein